MTDGSVIGVIRALTSKEEAHVKKKVGGRGGGRLIIVKGLNT